MSGHDCPTGYHDEPARGCYSHGCRCDECREEERRYSAASGSSPLMAFRLPGEERAAVERVAEAEGRTYSDLIREALRRYLAAHDPEELTAA